MIFFPERNNSLILLKSFSGEGLIIEPVGEKIVLGHL
jgi:hypothetical protein